MRLHARRTAPMFSPHMRLHARTVDLLFAAPCAGTSSKKFSFLLNATSTGGNATITVGVNNVVVGDVVVGDKAGTPIPVPGSVTLSPGVSALRLTMPDPPHMCFILHSISVVAE